MSNSGAEMQRAGMVGRSLLDLQSTVMNPETLFEGVNDVVHKDISGVAPRHHQMYRLNLMISTVTDLDGN